MDFPLLVGASVLFIYAIELLSNNLLSISLPIIKEKLKIFTNNFTSSFLSGFVTTTLVQSSSAIIMITIALINSNLLTFNQSIGIVLGSNIATTITSFIIGLNLEKISPFLLLISLLFIKNKNKKIQLIAKLTFSISLLFFSIFLMSNSTANLSNNPKIYLFINEIANNFFLSLLVGILLTVALQSSSVFIAIIQVLALGGFISINQAIPFIFGANIGTSFDPLFSLFSSNKESKKLAHFSILFNIITALIFTILIHPFTFILNTIINLFNFNKAINIAIINIVFNSLCVLITLPFLNKIKRYYAKW